MTTAIETEEKKKSRALPVALGVLGAALVLYAGFAAWLRVDGRFPFRTTLNGRDVSLRRALDVQQECMADYYRNMRFPSGAPTRRPTPSRPRPSIFPARSAPSAFSRTVCSPGRRRCFGTRRP